MAVLQPDHALTERIHQVVMGGIGKAQQLGDQRLVAALKRELPASSNGATAWARLSLLPTGLMAIKPGI